MGTNGLCGLEHLDAKLFNLPVVFTKHAECLAGCLLWLMYLK